MKSRLNPYFIGLGEELIKSSRASWPVIHITDKNGKTRSVRVNPAKLKQSEKQETQRQKIQRAKSTSDTDLVANVLAGSDAAKSQLYSKYKADAEKIIGTFVRDKETAKDLAVDTFVKVFNKIGDYSKVSSTLPFKSWFVRIAANTARDYLRSAQHAFNKNAASDEEKVSHFNMMDTGESSDKQAEQHETAQIVAKALSKIPSEYRDTIKDFYFEGLSIKEISKKYNISTSGVQARLKRGKEALKTLIPKDMFKAISPYFTLMEANNDISL